MPTWFLELQSSFDKSGPIKFPTAEISFDGIEISVSCCTPLCLVKLCCLRLLSCLLVNSLSDDTRLASLASHLIQGDVAITPESQCAFDLPVI